MRLSPDEMIFWQHGFLKLNGTIVFTWGLMFVMVVGSELITRNLSTELKRSRWQNLLEIVVTGIEKQIEDVGLRHPKKYIGFLGTLSIGSRRRHGALGGSPRNRCPPVATIDSGEVVTMSTVSGPPDALPPPPAFIPPALTNIHNAKTRRMLPGHMCTGPVAVRGARPGQVLQVDIQDIALRYDWGYTAIRPLKGALPWPSSRGQAHSRVP